MIAAQLPALQVVVPLIAAPLLMLLRRPGTAWLVATLATWSTLAIALALLEQVLSNGTISYAVGGWAPPIGIEYRVDLANALVLVIVALIGSIVMPYARASVAAEIEEERIYLFYAAYLLCLCGLLGIAITGDAFNLFVFLEISSLSSYALIAMGRDRRALTAAYRYLIMGTIGATFYVIGTGLMYMMTGTLNMADLAVRLPEVAETRTVLVALAFITVGIALKAAVFPLHAWLPNAYCEAPSMVTAFLAATATKVSIYVLVRMFFSVFGMELVFDKLATGAVLLTLAIVAMLAMSTVAIFEKDAKRLLAYSSIAQIGYMVLGFSLASQTGLTASLVHLFNHALIKGALFMALGAFFLRYGSVQLEDLAGAAKTMPWSAAAVVAGGLSLIGVPLTTGFVSKWLLVQAALEGEYWFVAAIILIASLLAIAYVWRLVEAIYFKAPAEGVANPSGEAPLSMLIPLWLLVLANIYFGIDTDLTAGVAGLAAEALIGGTP